MVKLEPNHHCESISELLFGESVLVLEQDALWCKIRSARDGYEGFVETAACDFTSLSPTHWVNTKATLVFESADIKSPVVQRLLFGSELTLSAVGGDQSETSGNQKDIDHNQKDLVGKQKFFKLSNSGFVWAAHCTEIHTPLKLSMIDIAQDYYLHAPYLWGGRSVDGCDCSGLVQMLAIAKGISLPRDSGDQEEALLSDVEYDNRAAEDLVYWPGHVGLLKSPELLLHSTAHSMRCCVEPIADVIQRAGFPSSIKNIS